jgi:hypothetical protein
MVLAMQMVALVAQTQAAVAVVALNTIPHIAN